MCQRLLCSPHGGRNIWGGSRRSHKHTKVCMIMAFVSEGKKRANRREVGKMWLFVFDIYQITEPESAALLGFTELHNHS